MAVSLKHTTQAVGTDAGNGEIRKAQWNEEHTLTAAANSVVARAAATDGAVSDVALSASQLLGRGSTGNVAPITLSANLTISGTQLDIGTGVATLAGTQTLSGKTLTEPIIEGALIEDIFTISDAASVNLDPSNGSIQLWVLGTNRTPVAPTSWAAGQSITLMVRGAGFNVTWTSIPVTWVGGSAPSSLSNTGYTVIQLWRVGSAYYGARVGDVA